MSLVDRVEIHVFEYKVKDLGLGAHAASGVGNMIHLPSSQLTMTRHAIRICCDDGAQGEYVTHWVGTPSTLGQMQMLAPNLLGRDPEQRELIYDDLKREVRAYDHMGHGALDSQSRSKAMPSCSANATSRGACVGVSSVTAVPSLPRRPVRPARCV